MRLTEAVITIISGHTIVSYAGKRYTPAQLGAKALNGRAAVFNSCGMTKKEREGRWRIDR